MQQPTPEQLRNLVLRQQRAIELMAAQSAQQTVVIAEQRAHIEMLEDALKKGEETAAEKAPDDSADD